MEAEANEAEVVQTFKRKLPVLTFGVLNTNKDIAINEATVKEERESIEDVKEALEELEAISNEIVNLIELKEAGGTSH